MKKFILVVMLLLVTISFSQEKKIVQPKNEIKINAFSLIAVKAFDLTYERLIDEESSYGVSLYLRPKEANEDFLRTFSFTPFYRRYFTKKYAQGFFIEGFGMLLNSTNYNNNNNRFEDQTAFALGVSAGGKFITKKGFVAEIFLGIGRKMGNNNEYFDIPIVGRGGITLGYRF